MATARGRAPYGRPPRRRPTVATSASLRRWAAGVVTAAALAPCAAAPLHYARASKVGSGSPAWWGSPALLDFPSCFGRPVARCRAFPTGSAPPGRPGLLSLLSLSLRVSPAIVFGFIRSVSSLPFLDHRLLGLVCLALPRAMLLLLLPITAP